MQRYVNFIASTTSTSSTLMVLSNATCTVYVAGTSTAATLYSDNGITPLANPFLSSSTGQVAFYAANGTYDLVVSKIGYLTVTISAIELDDLLAPSGSNSVGYLPAGTGAVATTVQTKLRESVSVKDFGAVGDGTTDDTAAIQAAVDYAKQINEVISAGNILNVKACVYVPAGIYNITGVTLYSSVRFIGAGQGSTYIKYTGTNGVAIDVAIGSNDALFGVSIENLYIRNFGSGSTKGIRADRASLTGESMAIRQCQLQNVTVQSFTNNVEIADSWTFALFRCFLWNASQFNLYCKNPTVLYAEACRFDIAGSDSVRLINSTNPSPGVAPLFVNCTFQKAQYWGLQAIDLQSCYLVNPFFEQNNLAGATGHCYFADGVGQYGRHFAIYAGHFTATGVSGSTGVRVGRAQKVIIQTDFQSTSMNTAVRLESPVEIFEDSSRYANQFLEIDCDSANTIVRRSGRRLNGVTNNTMEGTVLGSPGTMPTNWATTVNVGLTREIMAVGTENGIRYIDLKFSGTSTGTIIQIGFDGPTTISAAIDQQWTASAFVKNVSSLYGGSLANVNSAAIALRERNSVGGSLELSATNFSLATGNLIDQRYQQRRFTTNASTAYVQPLLFVNINNTSAVNFSVRIGLPQMESNAFASPVIYTSGYAKAEFT